MIQPVIRLGEAAGDGEGEGELGDVINQRGHVGGARDGVVVSVDDEEGVRGHPQGRTDHGEPQEQLGPVTAGEA